VTRRASVFTVVVGVALLVASGPSQGEDILELRVGGRFREARVFPGADAHRQPAPLVLVFHGLGDSAWNFANVVAFHKDWPQATVVYPEGRPRADRQRMKGWHGFLRNDENHDLAFADTLLEILPQRYRVDPQRIYVTGFSNGGHMTFNLLRARPCRFAAFAPIGALAEYVAEACTPRPVLYLFGRREPQEYTEAWQQTVVALARLNRATGEKREWAPGLTEFVPGPDGQVTVYGLYDAGHVWPSQGNEMVRDFLRRFVLDDTCRRID
jgi:poly(3-hydroxybutyrate) depolymerase